MTLPLMLEEFERVIVVDWSCPEKSGEWAAEQGAEVVYEPGHQYFNASKARNAGAKAVKSSQVCFIDADTMIMSGTGSDIANLLSTDNVVVASRNCMNVDVYDLGGFIALDMSLFWSIGGYDENLWGYALEDADLRARLKLELDVSVKRLSPGALGAIRHSHELRGKYRQESIEVSANRSHDLLTQYLMSKGVKDWVSDPRTFDIAFKKE